MSQPKINRRSFLEFCGGVAAASVLPGVSLLQSGCALMGKKSAGAFSPLAASDADELLLADGLSYKILVRHKDPINEKGDTFGCNNDFLCYLPLRQRDGLLWVNHETPHNVFVANYDDSLSKTKAQVEAEMYSVGGSILHVRESRTGEWSLVRDSEYNRRITGKTIIPFAGGIKVVGAKEAVGTLGNCAGGLTPWNTFLTCEENYDEFYGDIHVSKSGRRSRISKNKFDWYTHYDYPPEHYGWVVEVDPKTGVAKKLPALGRFAHEGATVVKAREGRAVVYMGDDKEGAGAHFYKFISDRPGSLESGTLYAADTERGVWLPLVRDKHKILREEFASQLDVMIWARKAAGLIGATELDRPEDVEVDARTRAVYLSLTNNEPRGNYFGSIFRLNEKDNDPLALEFKSDTFLTGGAESGFASPDNLAFDPRGNLWMTSDISSAKLNKTIYARFKNNGLFYVPLHGENAGRVFQVASAPKEAELTGPQFSPDGKTLFLSVQHPGEESKFGKPFTSHWPNGGNSMPASAVVTISGPLLDKLTAVKA